MIGSMIEPRLGFFAFARGSQVDRARIGEWMSLAMARLE